MDRLRTTLEHWRCAQAVVAEGGFASAAKALHKSQSSVSHAVKELSQRLGVPLFQIQGRRAVLTLEGRELLRRAERLLNDAAALENTARAMEQGFEVQLAVAVDVIAPNAFVIAALQRFAEAAPNTRVEVFETVLSGTNEALVEGRVQMALASSIPPGFIGAPLFEIEFLAVAHRDHALHHYGRPLDFDDLRQHRQMVLRDSGRQDFDAGWLGSEQRWTFTNSLGSLDAIRSGAGFAWLPDHIVREDLQAGRLRQLPLRDHPRRRVMLQLITPASPEFGPGAQALADTIKQTAGDWRA